MPVKSQASRHIVENRGDSVQVILPGKKNVFNLILSTPILLIWGFMTGGIIYFYVTIVVVSRLAASDSQFPGASSVPWLFLICLLPMFIFLLGIGGLSIYSFFWQISGREVIDVDSKTFTITRQILGWKKSRRYTSEKVKDLKVNPQNSHTPIRSMKILLGQAGMITFNDGVKTISFGLEIDEAEAKQIIIALQKG